MFRFFVTKLLSFVSCLPSSSAPQRGASTIYIVVILVIIIFALMLSGGPSYLLSGDIPSTVTETPAPSPKDSSELNPTATPSANVAWSLIYTLASGCANENGVVSKKGQIIAEGSSSGYIVLQIQDGTSYRDVQFQEFRSPKLFYPMDLKGRNGFDENNWRLRLYSGGAQQSENLWQGGTLEKEIGGQPTNCS